MSPCRYRKIPVNHGRITTLSVKPAPAVVAGWVVGFGITLSSSIGPSGPDSRALLTRVAGPALVLWGVLLVMGFAITGPLSEPLRSEIGVNKDLAADRTHIWNTITLVASYLGGTEVVIGASLIIGVVVWRTRDWRLAAVPAIAILAETAVFLSIASLVNRGRPPVDKLDMAPTSSTEADTLARQRRYISHSPSWALRIERSWLRRTTILV